MAKKKLILNESTTRRFMKLATIKPTYVSNFITEAEYNNDEDEDDNVMKEQEEEEEGMEMDAEPEMDADMEVEDEMGMEAPEEEPAGDEAAETEDAIMGLLGAVQDWAESKGVSMELEGDEGEEDAELEGGEMELADEAPGDEGDVEADLEAADVEVADEEAIVAEVTRRVARRLLRDSAKRK